MLLSLLLQFVAGRICVGPIRRCWVVPNICGFSGFVLCGKVVNLICCSSCHALSCCHVLDLREVCCNVWFPCVGLFAQRPWCWATATTCNYVHLFCVRWFHQDMLNSNRAQSPTNQSPQYHGSIAPDCHCHSLGPNSLPPPRSVLQWKTANP